MFKNWLSVLASGAAACVGLLLSSTPAAAQFPDRSRDPRFAVQELYRGASSQASASWDPVIPRPVAPPTMLTSINYPGISGDFSSNPSTTRYHWQQQRSPARYYTIAENDPLLDMEYRPPTLMTSINYPGISGSYSSSPSASRYYWQVQRSPSRTYLPAPTLPALTAEPVRAPEPVTTSTLRSVLRR